MLSLISSLKVEITTTLKNFSFSIAVAGINRSASSLACIALMDLVLEDYQGRVIRLCSLSFLDMNFSFFILNLEDAPT